MSNIAHAQDVNGELLEKVIINNDLGGLSPIEKVIHIKNVCKSLNLNPLTKPIQLLRFQGKEIPYVTKDATEQLRKNNKVSISKIDTKIMEGIYIVTAYACTPDGRQDSSTGAVSINGLKGDQLCNALLKAETKAKRRVTLSICGLGYIDECEAESIPNSTKIDVYANEQLIVDQNKRADSIAMITEASNLEELKSLYHKASEILGSDIEGKKLLNKETKILKEKFSQNIDSSTGEVN